MDRELFDGEFVSCLECAGILKSVAIFRNHEDFRNTKGLRHLVRHWCPSFHTFFFSVGELTITLEDVVNNFFIPVFGNENPFDINLSSKDLKIEDKLFNHFGGCTASSGGKLAKMSKWIMSLSQEKDKAFRQAGFLTLWLSKFLFSKFLGYGIKSIFFPLATRLARGAQYLYPPPLPPSHVFGPCLFSIGLVSWR